MNGIELVEMYGADAVDAALRKLEQDPAFREEAKADLTAAVQRAFGITLPVPMRLIEDEQGVRVEVLAAGDGHELSDSELDLVAGGSGASRNYGKDCHTGESLKSRAALGRGA